ncbi:MAG: SpoIIE family protein phosphatase [Bacteroidales bacterium]|nr:SpoIIE family protein phosphatase [Bacteroidales bacterium]
MKHLIVSILILLATSTGIMAQQDSSEAYLDLIRNANDPGERLEMAQKLLEYSAAHHDTTSMIEAYNFMAWSEYYLNNIDMALEYYTRQYNLATSTNNTKQALKSLYNLAGVISITEDYQESIRLYQQALTIAEKQQDTMLISRIYRDMGNNCANLMLYASAYENIRKAKLVDSLSHDSLSMANDYASLAMVHLNEASKNYDLTDKSSSVAPILSILENAQRDCEMVPLYLPSDADDFDRAQMMGTYYMCKAQIALYHSQKPDADSKKCIEEANDNNSQFLKCVSEIQDDEFIIRSWIIQSEIEYVRGNLRRALEITDTLKYMVRDTLWPNSMMDTYRNAAAYAAAMGNYKQAVQDFLSYDRFRAKYMNDNTIKQNAQFNADAESNKKISKLNEERDSQYAIRDEKISRQRTLLWLATFFILTVVAAIVIIFRTLRAKKHTLKMLHVQNEELNKQKAEILKQNGTINKQYQDLEKANSIIYQSIRYARHIQHAALPSKDTVQKLFPDAFIYYMPKDIVSGDFYYVAQSGNKNIFVVADCTGHGVPGGFLSMLGMSALQDIIRNTSGELDPGTALCMMRQYVKQALSNEEEAMQVTINGIEEQFSTADGMDMSIITFDSQTRILKFGGAYQNLYIAREGDLIRLKGDRMPVGRHINDKREFGTQTTELQKGDMLYMMTDGIASQMNCDKKKFMSRRITEFIEQNHHLPCELQKQNIAALMENWMQGAKQVDDITMVGIRIQ